MSTNLLKEMAKELSECQEKAKKDDAKIGKMAREIAELKKKIAEKPKKANTTIADELDDVMVSDSVWKSGKDAKYPYFTAQPDFFGIDMTAPTHLG